MRRLALTCTTALLLTLALIGPAHADATNKTDPRGDAPLRLDISSVTYQNGASRITARIKVPGLIRSGGVELVIGTGLDQGGTDEAYVATAAIRSDGGVLRSLQKRGNVSRTPVACRVQAKWKAARNFILLTVPRSCLPSSAGYDTTLYLQARTVSFLNEDEGDFASAASHLARD